MTRLDRWSAYRRRAVVAVVLDLPDEDPWTISEHIAVTPADIARTLTEAGRPDLAAPFHEAAIHAPRRDVVAAEVEHLAGQSVPVICRALDRTPSAVARSLQRAGRHDLARPFDRVVRAQRSRGRATRPRPASVP